MIFWIVMFRIIYIQIDVPFLIVVPLLYHPAMLVVLGHRIRLIFYFQLVFVVGRIDLVYLVDLLDVGRTSFIVVHPLIGFNRWGFLLVSFLQVCLIKTFIFSLLFSWILEKLALEVTENCRRFWNLDFQMRVELCWLFWCFKTDNEKK